MKKILLLSISLMFSFLSFSQDFYKVTSCKLETYVNERWQTVETSFPENMFIILKDKNVTITNNARSKFQILGEYNFSKYETHKTYFWEAYDDTGEQCILFIKTPLITDNIIEVTVMYNQTCFVYSVSKNDE